MAKDDRETSGATGRISEEALERLRSRGAAERARVSMLLYTRDGVTTVPLNPDQPVTMGRSTPSDVKVRDSSLSRTHARLTLQGTDVLVEDLGSTNGTWLAGTRIERATAKPGSDMSFGAVPASIHLAAGGGDWREIDGHDTFMAQLGRELARAHHHHRSFALVLARSMGKASVAPWLPTLRGALRPFDPLGLYSRDTVEILLPEVDRPQAHTQMKRLAATANLRCGMALYPEHASTAEALLELALEALRGTGPGRSMAVTGTAAVHTHETTTQPIVKSQAMRWVFNTAKRLADSHIPVLITGETGTGKEVVARAIHRGGKRRDRPMVCVNCGGIPSQLVESTLFGHERGAFTGAGQQRRGVFEAADGGTVLLDELGELPPSAQAALLRVLENKRFSRVGSSAEIEVDVRVLAATHRDIEAMCEAKEFRWDLLYRLNVMTLELPPLRKRPEEIEPLASRFLQQANRANDRDLQGLEPEALGALRSYAWPGNVRELHNAIERAVVICGGTHIAVEDLPRRIRTLATRAVEPRQRAGQAAPEGRDLKATLQQLEADLILAALERSGWDRKQAADALGLPLRTLAHKMKAHGIRRGGYEKGS